jgi:hypothetical protein
MAIILYYLQTLSAGLGVRKVREPTSPALLHLMKRRREGACGPALEVVPELARSFFAF